MTQTSSLRALLFAAVAGLALPLQSASAQTVLSDYESTEQAQRLRDNALWRLAFRPSVQVLDQTVTVLASGARLRDSDASEVAALTTKARALPESEARQLYWQAVSRILGKSWGPGQQLVGAIDARVAQPVVLSDNVRLGFSAAYPVPSGVQAGYKVTLLKGAMSSSATPQRGEVVANVAQGMFGKAFPQAATISFKGAPDGFYILLTQVSASDGATTDIASPFYLQHGLEKRRKALEGMLAKVTGHDVAKETARYPFELIAALNAGKREVISYDFNAALARSNVISSELAKGNDLVERAKGLQNRAYRFAETGELVPYQVFVPSTWSPDRKWPMVVALHGANLDETNMLGRADGQMQKLAEQHGFVVVAPLGYRINSAYGGALGKMLGSDDARVRRSEADVLALTDMIAAEYNADSARIYLTGNSMGGGGTWHIGGKYPDRWAAIAPAAFGGVTPEDALSLSRLPILAVVGDKDELGMLDRVNDAVAVLRKVGARPGYIIVPDGNHANAFDRALPRIFDFFENYSK